MSNYKRVVLRDVLTVKRGQSLSGDYYASSGKYIRLTLGNFNYPGGGFKDNTSKDDIYFTGPFKPQFLLKKGDIITPLTEQVRGLLGCAATIPEDDLYIQSGDVGLVIPNEKVLDKRFAYYLVSSPIVKRQLDAGSQQTKIRHTSPDKIMDCIAYIPESKEEQHKIAFFLDSINERIANNNLLRQEIFDLLVEVYNSWFFNFNIPDTKIQPLIKNDELHFKVPSDWKIVSLGDLYEEKPKSKVQVGQAKSLPGDIPFFTSGDDILRYKESLVDGLNIYMNTGGNASIKVFKGKAAYSTDTWCINAKDYTLYLFLFLTSIIDNIQNYYFAGSDLKHLQKEQLAFIRWYIPPKEILDKFNKALDKYVDLYSNLLNETYELEKIRDTYFPLLMNGQASLN